MTHFPPSDAKVALPYIPLSDEQVVLKLNQLNSATSLNSTNSVAATVEILGFDKLNPQKLWISRSGDVSALPLRAAPDTQHLEDLSGLLADVVEGRLELQEQRDAAGEVCLIAGKSFAKSLQKASKEATAGRAIEGNVLKSRVGVLAMALQQWVSDAEAGSYMAGSALKQADENKHEAAKRIMHACLTDADSLDLAALNLRSLPKNVFASLPQLTSLNLGNNRFVENPASLKDLAAQLLDLNQLGSLNLENTHFGASPELARILLSAISGQTQLTELNIAGNALGMQPKSAEALAVALGELKQITHLDLSHNQLCRDIAPAMPVFSVLSQMRNLRQISLMGNGTGTKSAVYNDWLLAKPLFQIRHHVSENIQSEKQSEKQSGTVGDTGLIAHPDKAKWSEEDFSQCIAAWVNNTDKKPDEDRAAVAEQLMSAFKNDATVFTLRANQKVTSLPWAALGQLRTLKTLNLSMSRIVESAQQCNAFAEQVGQLTQLEKVSLAGTSLNHHPENVASIFGAFADIPQLSSLNLMATNLGANPACLSVAADVIEGLTQLTELNLSHNNIAACHESTQTLLIAVSSLSCMQRLDLSNNLMLGSDEETSIALLSALRQLQNLKNLNLENTDFCNQARRPRCATIMAASLFDYYKQKLNRLQEESNARENHKSRHIALNTITHLGIFSGGSDGEAQGNMQDVIDGAHAVSAQTAVLKRMSNVANVASNLVAYDALFSKTMAMTFSELNHLSDLNLAGNHLDGLGVHLNTLRGVLDAHQGLNVRY